MSNFKVGEKVVCVDANHALINNKIYTVMEIITCCGKTNLAVDIIHRGLVWTCHICDVDRKSNGYLSALSSRFRKLSDILSEQSESDLNEIEKTFEEVKELQPVNQ